MSKQDVARARRYVDAFAEFDMIAYGAGDALLAYRRQSRAPRCPPPLIVVAALHNHVAYLRQFVDRASAEHFFAAEPHLAAFVLAHAAKNNHMGVLRELYATYQGSVPLVALVQAKRRCLRRLVAFLTMLPGKVHRIDVDDSLVAPAPSRSQGGDVAFSLLTNASLMAAIGAFQPRPELDSGTTIVLTMYRLEALFCMRRGGGWRPNLASMFSNSFPASKTYVNNKQYLAAADGRRQLLALLDKGNAEWMNLIEWLEAHRPEQAHAVSDRDLAEIALSGDIKALKACHAFEIGQFSPLVMDLAIMGQSVRTVEWLVEEDVVCASVYALAFALAGASSDMRHTLARQLLVSPRLDPSVKEQAVRTAVLHACRSDDVDVWEELRGLVTQIQISDLQRSDDVQTTTARQTAPPDVMERLSHHHGRGAVGSDVLSRARHVATHPINDAFMTFLLETLTTSENQDVAVAPPGYCQLLKTAAQAGNVRVLRNLFDLETAQGGIYSPDHLVQLLQLAQNDASIAKVVLEHGGYQFTKAIVLPHAPQCLVGQLIRYFTANEAVRRLPLHEPHESVKALHERRAPLTWREMEAVMSLEDTELSGFMWSRARGCLSYWVVNDAIQAGATLLCLQRLKTELDCEIPKTAMDVACQLGRADVVQWLVEQCGMQEISISQLQRATGNAHIHLLEYVHGLQVHRDVLSSAVRGTLENNEATPRETAVRLLDFAEQLLPPILDDGALLGMAARWAHADLVRRLVSRKGKAGDTTFAVVEAAKRGDFDMVDTILNHVQLHSGLMQTRAIYGFDFTGNLAKLIDLLALRVPTIRAELDQERAWTSAPSTADAVDWGLSLTATARTRKQRAAARRAARWRRLGKPRCRHRHAARTRLSKPTAADTVVPNPLLSLLVCSLPRDFDIVDSMDMA